MKPKIFISAFWSAAIAVLSLPLIVSAQTTDACNANSSFRSQFNGAFNWVPSSYCTASGVALYVVKLLLEFSGTAAIIFIMIGGFFYVTSAGNEEQSEKGRKILINAVIGLVVIILATAIVTIISNTITSGS